MKHGGKHAGFTLIEIMVTLIIIALSVTIISVSTNSLQARNELQPFVDNLYQKLNNLEQDAMLRQVEIGLNIYTNKIEVLHYKYDPNNTNTADWKIYKTLSVPRNISLKYEILEADQFIKIVGANNQPEITITSGGYMTPFRLVITHPDEKRYYVISTQFSGEISLMTEQG